ncbi:MAG: hypothetical protein OEM15_06970 [Myxococcales bacterium]|nr:hypothetical protein [Myxococcales bacterium]MDH3483308.1 hypothetical protein [Myxococcales bacterium]
MTRALVVVILLAGCQRSTEPPVAISPDPDVMLPDVPSDPFGTPGQAYERLRQITDDARTTSWSGQVQELAAWLEGETTAVEQSLTLMKTLRLGASDVYAVANGRIALVYEHIASTLTEAEVLVKDRDSELDLDWIGQQAVLWERANAFWARCARGCSSGGPYLDVWELRCRAGADETSAKFGP